MHKLPAHLKAFTCINIPHDSISTKSSSDVSWIHGINIIIVRRMETNIGKFILLLIKAMDESRVEGGQGP